MYIKMFIKMLVISATYLIISSCGGENNLGGNVTEFKNSIATASPASPRLEADLITGNTCTSTGSTGGTIVTENIDFTIQTTANTTGTANPLPLSITGYTVSFSPKNAGAPVISNITSNYTPPSIIPGSSVTIPVAIITDKIKIDLLTANSSIACSLSIYQYDVTVSFHAAEVGSGSGSKDINAGMVMALADRNNL